jgi:hypothetical protein
MPAPKPKPPAARERQAGWPQPWRTPLTAEDRIRQMVKRVVGDPTYVKETRRHLEANKTARMREYVRKRRKKDPAFKLRMNLRSRLRAGLKAGRRSPRLLRLIGCSWEDLLKHLESQFTDEMSWDNYGSYWHLDHIIPLAAFNLDDTEHLRACCHWTNLQPLEKSENLRKKHSMSNEVKADLDNYVYLVNHVI